MCPVNIKNNANMVNTVVTTPMSAFASFKKTTENVPNHLVLTTTHSPKNSNLPNLFLCIKNNFPAFHAMPKAKIVFPKVIFLVILRQKVGCPETLFNASK